MKIFLSAALAALLVTGCGKSAETSQSPAQSSPTGKWSVEMVDVPNPTNPKLNLTKVTILDFEGVPAYEDQSSNFRSFYALNHAWDDQDRLWTWYEADDSVYFWQLEDNHWQKRKWGKGRESVVYDDLVPPESIYP